MIIHAVVQGSPEWVAIRAGIPTTSCFDRIITAGSDDWDGESKKGEPKPSTQATKYMNHLLAERILGQAIEGFQSEWMARGSEMEKRAVAAYEFSHDCDTEPIGFVTSDDLRIGCSPDRFIVGCDDGHLEAKAPSPAVHIGYLLSSTGAATEYKQQLQGQLWVCERGWVDIISFHPEMPDAVFRVNRDEKYIGVLSRLVRAFSDELEEKTEQFKERGWIKTLAA